MPEIPRPLVASLHLQHPLTFIIKLERKTRPGLVHERTDLGRHKEVNALATSCRAGILAELPAQLSFPSSVWSQHLMVQIRPAYAAHSIGTLCVVPQGHVLTVGDTGRS